jgi:CheY-like chemotaxis protein
VVNLLTNAAKYTDEGGRISLTVTSEFEDVVIRVGDSGIGIAPEMLPRLFDPFMQIENSLAQARGGIGLGLPLVRELVRLHGGNISAESEGVGYGSVFIVRLPGIRKVAAPHATAPLERPEQMESSRRQRVLLVEDHVDAANGLARMLIRSGHQVEIAFNGAQALSMAEDLQPDVVICDIGLPDMDGCELANRLRELFRDQPLRLISLSGYQDEHHRRRAREAGFDEQFVKPVDLAALRDALVRSKTGSRA